MQADASSMSHGHIPHLLQDGTIENVEEKSG